MIDIQDLKNKARGRWLSIFESMGIEVPPDGEHGPCPIENEGKDRFRVSNRDGSGDWICTNCGSGDGLALIRQCLGLSFTDVLRQVSEIVGGVLLVDDTKPKLEYDPKESLNRLWKASSKLTGSDPVSRYLHARGITLEPEYVRYCPECWESDTKKKMPAMVAMFAGVDGKAVSLHRTYLEGDKKASIKAPKKLMRGTSPLSGGAIRLCPPKHDTIGIAEGIETAMSVRQITGFPCWSAVSSTLLKAFQPPEGIKKIVIFADRDANFTGQQAAYTLANRLYSKDLIVEVEIPDILQGDFNDVLKNDKEQADGKS